MATEHTVKPGECFASLAEQHGFSSYKTLYDHPENAALKSRRPNPNVLCPGDIVHIPDKRVKHEVRATGQSHVFQLRARPPVPLRIVIQNNAGEPQSGVPYTLTVQGQTFHGKADGKGLIEHSIDPKAQQAELTVWLKMEAFEGEVAAQEELVIPLAIGCLDPVETTSGVQARLNNLGFPCGGATGVWNKEAQDAMQRFQQKHGLPVTSRPTAALQDKLRQLHGS